MNEFRPRDRQIERLLTKAHLSEAPSQLRDQVTTAARQAWQHEPTDVSWRVPLRRLALSTAAAFVAVSLSNRLSDLAGPRVEYKDTVTASVSDAGLEELTMVVYGPSGNRLGTGHPGDFEANIGALRDRMEAVRSMLDEMERRTDGTQQAPSGGASRLSQPRDGLHA
jgi:hypothetical protein